MKKGISVAFGLIAAAVYAAAFCYFYYVYVPLVVPFQLILVPLLLLTLVFTLIRIEWGLVWFVLAYPLAGNLPYFFGIDEHVPHAPVALVLFLAFLGGWLGSRAVSGHSLDPSIPIRRPAALFAAVVAVSAVVTFWRYSGFEPFFPGGLPERFVNVNLVRAGGAAMSDVFNSLNYLTGLAFLLILLDSVRTRALARRLLTALTLSLGFALLFSLVQRFLVRGLGNTPGWTAMGQLNATFKDPNAFGALVSAGVPLLLGLALASRKGSRRAVWLAVLALAIFVLPWIGTRSPVLAVVAGLLVFGVLSLSREGPQSRRRITLGLATGILLTLIGLAAGVFFGRAILTQRLTASLDSVVNRGGIVAALGGKPLVWSLAVTMTRDFPLTGVGTGAYIIELPNYLRSLGRPTAGTDSAENLLLQTGAELGLIGLALFLWIMAILVARLRTAWRESAPDAGDRLVRTGVYAALASLAVNFVFHSYIGSFDVMYTFWLLVGLGLAGSLGSDARRAAPAGAPGKGAAFILIGLFAISHVWTSTHSLSLAARTAEYGLRQNFGLYDKETGQAGVVYRWTGRSAGFTVYNLGPVMVVPMMVSHPDLERRPVRARIYLADASLRRKSLLREVVFTEKDWQNLEYAPPPGQKMIHLVICLDRAWQPRKALQSADPRTLGLALGEIWFKLGPRSTQDENPRILQRVSAKGWSGEFGSFLPTNGTSKLAFSTDRPHLALRLWVKGQKALGTGPLIVLRLDEQVIGRTMIESRAWTPLMLRGDCEAGDHVLSVEFTNDFSAPGTDEDRNVWLGNLEIVASD